MNWITITGIIIIALGTYLTYYGTTIESKKDKTELNNKLDEFDKKLENTLNNEFSNEGKKNEIEELKNEYLDWVNDFSKNKNQLKIKYQKKSLNVEENKEFLNNEWNELYVYFFNQLESIVLAYNSSNEGSKIEILNKSEVPKNLFYFNQREFNYSIKFKESNYWKISLFFPNQEKATNIPDIDIQVLSDLDSHRVTVDLNLSINLKDKKLFVSNEKYFNPVPLQEDYDLNDDFKSFDEILKSIFEYQIVLND